MSPRSFGTARLPNYMRPLSHMVVNSQTDRDFGVYVQTADRLLRFCVVSCVTSGSSKAEIRFNFDLCGRTRLGLPPGRV